MVSYEKQRIEEIYGKDYLEMDIPTYIRQREAADSEEWAELHGAYQDKETGEWVV